MLNRFYHLNVGEGLAVACASNVARWPTSHHKFCASIKNQGGRDPSNIFSSFPPSVKEPNTEQFVLSLITLILRKALVIFGQLNRVQLYLSLPMKHCIQPPRLCWQSSLYKSLHPLLEHSKFPKKVVQNYS